MSREGRCACLKYSGLKCEEDLNEAELLHREKVAGVWKFASVSEKKARKGYTVEIGPDEAKLINVLGMYSPDELYNFLKTIKSSLAMMSIEEQNEIDRARVLNIFSTKQIF